MHFKIDVQAELEQIKELENQALAAPSFMPISL